MTTHPGWTAIIAKATDLVEERRGKIKNMGVDADGLLEIAIQAPEARRTAELSGVTAIARALSGEVCLVCGGAGDPVVLPAGAGPATRCFGCRPVGCTLRSRRWRRERHPGRDTPDPEAAWNSHRRSTVIEDRYAEHRLQGLMEHWYHAEDDRASFVNGISGGWSHIIRAMLLLLMPLQDADEPEPWRLWQMKEKFGSLRVHATGGGSFANGVLNMVGPISMTTCLTCGQPGEITDVSLDGESRYWAPACPRCGDRHQEERTRRSGEDFVRRRLENERRFQGKHPDMEKALADAMDEIDRRIRERPRATPAPGASTGS